VNDRRAARHNDLGAAQHLGALHRPAILALVFDIARRSIPGLTISSGQVLRIVEWSTG
jgi:hypothetical protein